MKKGIYAIYEGKEYPSSAIDKDSVVLRSDNIKDIKNNNFIGCEPFIFRRTQTKIVCLKHVTTEELADYYKYEIYIIYQGEKFCLLEETDSMYSIVIVTMEMTKWIERGFNAINKGELQKWINKDEAEVIREKRSLMHLINRR